MEALVSLVVARLERRRCVTVAIRRGESDRIKFSHWSDKCDKYHPNLQAKVPKHEQRQLHAMNQETETPLSTSKKKRKKKKKKQ